MRSTAIACVQLLTVLTVSTASQEDESVRLKRLNPFGLLPNPTQGFQSILNSFDVRANTIIRTNDSLQAGAKYLSERQLRSSAECSLYCWEMSSCNVAVFEEKSNGACYLFDCGTPDNFECQFTAHDAYTVALLTTRSQHENELVSLKHAGHGHGEVQDQRFRPGQGPAKLGGPSSTSLSSGPGSSTSTSSSSSSTTTTTTSTTSTTTTTSTSTTTTTRKPEITRCVEHQFRCVNSSECIAIYDVCNGIPQCADGSDEAETLDCHARDGSKQPLPQQAQQQQQQLQMPKQVELTDSQLYEIVRPLQEKLQEKEEAVYRHPGVYEETRQREYPPYRGDIYRANQAADYGDVYAGRRFSGLFSQQQDFQPSRFEDSPVGGGGGGGGGGYGGGTAGTDGLYQSASAMRRGYDNAPDFPTNYYPYGRDRGSAYGGGGLGGLAGDQGGRNLDTKAGLFGSPRYSPGGSGPPQQQESEKQLQMAKTVNTNIVRDPLSSLELAKSSQGPDAGSPTVDAASAAVGSSEAKPRRRPGKFMDEAPPPPQASGGSQPATSSGTAPVSAATNKPEPGPPAKQIASMANMHISVTQVETKSSSSTTPGAMVGLALGVCMSTLFLFVVGCRLNMRRRLSRWRRSGSKKGLSLLAPEDDEDYLVNGMYL